VVSTADVVAKSVQQLSWLRELDVRNACPQPAVEVRRRAAHPLNSFDLRLVSCTIERAGSLGRVDV
jgi:hypothetical protein